MGDESLLESPLVKALRHLHSLPPGESLVGPLGELAKVCGAEQAWVVPFAEGEAHGLHATRWSSQSDQGRSIGASFWRGLLASRLGDSWRSILRAGGAVAGPEGAGSRPLIEHLQSQGLGAWLAVPVFHGRTMLALLVIAQGDSEGTWLPYVSEYAGAWAAALPLAVAPSGSGDGAEQPASLAGQLSGGIAHEFNNLLTVLIARLQFAQREPGCPPAVHEHLEAIAENAAEAAKLCRLLLGVARRRRGAQQVMELNVALRDTLPVLRCAADAVGAQVDIKFELAARRSMVRAEPGGIYEALARSVMLVLGNQKPSGSLILTSRDGRAGEVEVNLRLETDGEPMPVAPSAQVEQWRANLSADGFAQLEGPGEYGFVLPVILPSKHPPADDLPRRSSPRPVSQSSRDAKRPPSSPRPPLSPRPSSPSALTLAAEFAASAPRASANTSVLLVDDSATIRRLSAKRLGDAGFQVLQAQNGVEALRMLAGSAGDEVGVMVTDLLMPLMGGEKLVARVRQERPNIAVLLTTGEAIPEALSGPNAAPILRKPYSLDQLVDKVRELLVSPPPAPGPANAS